jgi:hypothetical protein
MVILGSPSSYITLQPIPSEFSYIGGNLFSFYQCRNSSVKLSFDDQLKAPAPGFHVVLSVPVQGSVVQTGSFYHYREEQSSGFIHLFAKFLCDFREGRKILAKYLNEFWEFCC